MGMGKEEEEGKGKGIRTRAILKEIREGNMAYVAEIITMLVPKFSFNAERKELKELLNKKEMEEMVNVLCNEGKEDAAEIAADFFLGRELTREELNSILARKINECDLGGAREIAKILERNLTDIEGDWIVENLLKNPENLYKAAEVTECSSETRESLLKKLEEEAKTKIIPEITEYVEIEGKTQQMIKGLEKEKERLKIERQKTAMIDRDIMTATAYALTNKWKELEKKIKKIEETVKKLTEEMVKEEEVLLGKIQRHIEAMTRLSDSVSDSDVLCFDLPVEIIKKILKAYVRSSLKMERKVVLIEYLEEEREMIFFKKEIEALMECCLKDMNLSCAIKIAKILKRPLRDEEKKKFADILCP